LYVSLMFRSRESGDPPKVKLRDPYQLAYLSGGPSETLRTVVVSLLDRKLLEVVDDDGRVVARDRDAAERVADRIERDVLAWFRAPSVAHEMFESASLVETARRVYAPELERLGLLPDDAVHRERISVIARVIAVLIAIAAVKLAVAAWRGRSNVAFLVIE